ncbi:MAG: zinc-ribbon and DUF3426 domain-containing protein, partial [Deefgea sp.]
QRMSQITCGPNCSTTFRVTDAQLAAHQGKVRCGRCAFVFHAPDFIQSLIIETPEAAEQNTVITPLPLKETAQTQPITTDEAKDTGIDLKTNLLNSYTDIPNTQPQETPTHNRDQLIQLANEELELDAAFARNEALLDDTNQNEIQRKSHQTERPTIEIDSDSEYQPILTDDDLFAPAKPKSRFTWMWVLGCAFASIALVAQLVFVFRNELSQEFPALRPKLIVLCEHLNCTLPLPREAQLLRSEYSELTFIPNSPTLIQLNATLRNLAPFAQELPKLEVTLTDENEKVIARKIFTAKQYMVQNERPQNSIEANEEIRAFLQLDLGELNSTGYSLYWFY